MVLRLRQLIVLFILSFPPSLLSASDSEALLKLKKSFTKADALSSWSTAAEPCKDKPWNGVVCYRGTVVSLRMSSMGISGTVDIDALIQIKGLRSISLNNNEFDGPIPEFNRLLSLRTLYISGNKFSGKIADDYFAKMDKLKKIYLSSNSFEGPIPTSVTKLTHLIELHFDNNQFSGKIPPLAQSSLVSLDLSDNKLEGEIPGSLSRFNQSSFIGNAGLCGIPLGKACNATMAPEPGGGSEAGEEAGAGGAGSPPPQKQKEDETFKLVVAVVMLVLVFVMLLGATIVVVQRRKEEFDFIARDSPDERVELHVSPTVRNTPGPLTNPMQRESESMKRTTVANSTRRTQGGKGAGAGDLVVVNDEKGIFGLPDLMKAAAEVLGNGSLGSAYKAVMTNGVAVVVKRMREMNRVGRDGFDMEMRRLGELHHRNILTPLAYHYRKEEKLVVYEYVPKGSLLYLLHGDRGSCQAELDWLTRLRIVHGIARGMGFLHSELDSYDLPHGNLKSSNIFLGSNFEPLIADYGFWSLVNPTQASQAMFAYKAPEYTEYRHASPKCDVYCFGIIILEILTGKFPSQYLNNGTGGTDVVQWVQSAILEGRITDLFDPEIATSSSSFGDMEQLLHIGASCVEQNPDQRPSMKEVVRKIEEIPVEGVGPQFTSTLKEEYAKLSASGESV